MHRTDVSLCVLCAYVSTLSAVFAVLPANLSVSACVERAQHFSVWVAGICPSRARARSLPVFVCLSRRQADCHKCLWEKERSHRSRLKDSPQREARSPSISVGICDCRRSDKMPLGQRSALRQAGILHCTDERRLEALSGTKAALLKLNTGASTGRGGAEPERNCGGREGGGNVSG